MANPSDDQYAATVLGLGKATPEQVEDARTLAAKMRELGVQRDLLGALVDRSVLTPAEADEIRAAAAAAAEAPSPEAPAAAPPPPAPGGGDDDADVEEAEAVEEAEEAGAGPLARAGPVAPAEAAPAAPPAPADAPPARGAPPAPALQASPALAAASGRPACYRHPDQSALFRCFVCGRPICAACVVQTRGKEVCGQDCLFRLTTGKSAGVLGDLVAALAKLAVVAVIFGGTAAGVLYLRRPSKELAETSALRDRVSELEKAGDFAAALESARELASLPVADKEALELVSWGKDRRRALETQVGLTEVEEFRRAISSLAEADADEETLKQWGANIDDLVRRFPEATTVRQRAEELRGLLRRQGAAAEQARVEAAKSADEEAVHSAIEALEAEIETLLAAGKFAEAGGAVQRARARAGASANPVLSKAIASADARIADLAQKAYDSSDRAAQALIAEKRYAEARKVYQRVVDTYGVERIVKLARARLGAVVAAERDLRMAAEQAAVEKAKAQLADAARLVRSFEYGAAVEQLNGLSGPVGRADAELLLEAIRRERAVLARIIALVRAGPVDLALLGHEQKAGRKDALTAADEKSYTVTITVRRHEITTFESPWNRMSPLELCRLGNLATKERTVDALIDLSVFCRGRGASVQAAAAAAEARRVGGAEATAELERFTSYPAKVEALAAEADRASADAGPPEPAAPGPRAEDKAAKADKEEEQDKEEEAKSIEEPCPICLGSGATKEIGCAECRATGYKGVAACGGCGGDGKAPYRCSGCAGTGAVLSDRQASKCPRCAGKGSPLCLACSGSGKMKRLNPAAANYPTIQCPLCRGSCFDPGVVRCPPCGGTGKIELKDMTREVVWVRLVTCNSCGGQGRRPPLCGNCMGRGYVRPPGMLGSAKIGVACRACFGTGQVIRKCRGCAGRGYVRAGRAN